MVGINDIYNGIAPDRTINYMRLICKMIHTELPDSEIFIQSILPTSDKKYESTIRKLNDKYKKLCDDDIMVDYVDLYSLFVQNNMQKLDFFYDGIHLTGKGYSIWINKIKDYIE